MARPGELVVVRRRERAHRTAQRVVPDRAPAPDRPAHARLRPRGRAPVPAGGARAGVGAGEVPGGAAASLTRQSAWSSYGSGKLCRAPVRWSPYAATHGAMERTPLDFA